MDQNSNLDTNEFHWLRRDSHYNPQPLNLTRPNPHVDEDTTFLPKEHLLNTANMVGLGPRKPPSRKGQYQRMLRQ